MVCQCFRTRTTAVTALGEPTGRQTGPFPQTGHHRERLDCPATAAPGPGRTASSPPHPDTARLRTGGQASCKGVQFSANAAGAGRVCGPARARLRGPAASPGPLPGPPTTGASGRAAREALGSAPEETVNSGRKGRGGAGGPAAANWRPGAWGGLRPDNVLGREPGGPGGLRGN